MQVLISPTSVMNAIPQSQVPLIQAALAGAAGTSNYFRVRNQLTQLCQIASRTPAADWPTTSTQTGQQTSTLTVGPMSIAVATSMSGAGSTGTTATGGTSTEGSAQAGTVMVNGTTYNVVGSTQITFSVEQYAWVTECVISAASFVASVGTLQSLPSTVAQAVVRGVIGGVSALSSGGTAAVTAGEADSAATEAVAGASDAEAALDVAALAGSFLGFLGALAVAYAVADLILHQTQHRITVINLTDYPITWSTPYISEGALQSAPSTSSSSGGTSVYVTDYVIPGMQLTGPPFLTQVPAYSSADFQFVSSDTSGLGYVMEFTFTDTGSNTAYMPMVTFDIPFEGDNSLNCVFGSGPPTPGMTPSEVNAAMAGNIPLHAPSGWYGISQGQNKVTSLAATSPDGKYRVTATYDLLSGQQPDPTGSSVGYFYNSIIAIQPA